MKDEIIHGKKAKGTKRNNSNLRQTKRIETLYSKTEKIIKLFAGILALFFGYLEFRGTKVPFMTDDWAEFILKISLAVLYSCWIFGCIADLRAENYTFEVYPNKNKLTVKSLAVIIILAILFGILCWANTFELFTIALSALFLFNVFSWRFIVKFAQPTFDENRIIAINNFGYEYQKILENYLLGSWQWYRFAFGAFLIILLNFLIFTKLHIIVASILGCSTQVLISLSLFSYVIILETWVWAKRIERILSFKILDSIDDRYIIKRKHPVLKSEEDEG